MQTHSRPNTNKFDVSKYLHSLTNCEFKYVYLYRSTIDLAKIKLRFFMLFFLEKKKKNINLKALKIIPYHLVLGFFF